MIYCSGAAAQRVFIRSGFSSGSAAATAAVGEDFACKCRTGFGGRRCQKSAFRGGIDLRSLAGHTLGTLSRIVVLVS